MNKNLVKEINKAKDFYTVKLGAKERKDLASTIDFLWKDVRMDERLANADALHKNVVGEETTVDYFAGFEEKGYIQTSMEEYEEEVSANGKTAVKNFIGIYAAAKEALEKRTIWDKLFHPVKTYRENKTFEELKEALEVRGITEEIIEDYYKTNDGPVLIDEALEENNQVNIDLGDEAKEVEPFEKSAIGIDLSLAR